MRSSPVREPPSNAKSSMPRSERLYLDDILEAIEIIREYVKGMDERAFIADRKTMDATIRHLLVLGEAVSRLSTETMSKTPQVEWRKIKALRNLLVHAYFGVSPAIVWDVIASKLDGLEEACRSLVDQHPTDRS